MVNKERARRGFTNNPFCDKCRAAIEDDIHVLRDCSETAKFWRSHVPAAALNKFFGAAKDEWFKMNYSNSHLRSVLWPNLPWTVIFLAALWVLWKVRNALMFDKKKLPMNIILFFVRELASDFQGIFFKNHGGSEKGY